MNILRIPRLPHLGCAGISILETLVAVLIIAIGALGAIVVQRTGVKENQRTYSREVAASLARQLLEEIDSLSYEPTTGTYANCLNATGGANTFVNPCAALSAANPLNPQGQNVAAGGYTRQWSIQNTGTGVPTTSNYKTIRVRVQWKDIGLLGRGQVQDLIVTANKAWTFPTSP
jgi:type IV pilus modification protein PilV